MKIKEITISNFRSINKITLKIDVKNNFISFSGANNVGKTNILNALNLFFNNLDYNPEKDCPYHKFYGTRGGHYQPKIQVVFDSKEDQFDITKNWNLTTKEKKEEKKYKIIATKNNIEISDIDAETFIENINFFYLPSINISFPEVIKYIMNNDVIDLETGNTRLSGKKGKMKKNIEKTLEDLQEILNSLGDNISPLLEMYKDGWGVAFDLPKEVNTFRDLMIGKVDFYIKDKSSSKAIDAKGAGLQRLSHILMYFRIIDKLKEKKQNAIVAIDEPDVYLHAGLQKKLVKDVKERLESAQFFITTHSPIFIDTSKLSNVFLLEQQIHDKEYQRAQRKYGVKKFNAISTVLVDFNEQNGITKLKQHLGIETTDNLLFDKYTILVEGEEDKIYIEKLMGYFSINIPHIIQTNGADNILKFLDFYNGLSKKEDQNYFLVLLDNDEKGRKVNKKIKAEKYKNIKIGKKFVISYLGFNPKLDKNGNNSANIEIEDLINPEVLCYLANKIFVAKSLKSFLKKDIKDIEKKIGSPAFQNNGILALLENKKNELNPNEGQNIKVDSDAMKSGMAGLFKELDKNVIEIIGETSDMKNKFLVKFLNEISKK